MISGKFFLWPAVVYHASLFCVLCVGAAASGLWDVRVTWAGAGCAANLRFRTAKNK